MLLMEKTQTAGTKTISYDITRFSTKSFNHSTTKEFKENVEISKEVFGVIMRGSFGRYEEQRFQPCKDELYILKSLPKAIQLCRDLRQRVSLRDFYQILLPGELII